MVPQTTGSVCMTKLEYERKRKDLVDKLTTGQINAHEWAQLDRSLDAEFAYEDLASGRHECDAVLAKWDRRNRISA